MDDLQQKQSVSLPPPLQQTPGSRFLSRRRVLAGLIGVAGLASVGGGVAFWRYHQSQTPVYIYSNQDKYVSTVAWSPDGKRIATGGYTVKRIASDDSASSFSQPWSIHIWDAFTGHHMVSYSDANYQFNHLCWSPDSRLIAFAFRFGDFNESAVRILNADTGATLSTYPKTFDKVESIQNAVAWSPDGKRIALAGADSHSLIQTFDTLTSSPIMTYASSLSQTLLYAVAWSTDGKYLAATGMTQPEGELEHKYSNYSVLEVWNALTGASVFRSPPLSNLSNTYLPLSCSWAPDSQRVVVNSNTTAQVWNILNQKLLYTYEKHSQKVNAVAWSPDGKRIASGSDDTSVQVWDAQTGEQEFTFSGHSKAVNTVAWSPDSTYIVSGSADGTAQVWYP